MAGDKVHSEEPLTEGNLRVLKDSPNGNGEVRLAVVAVVAVVSSVGTAHAVVVSAERANHIVLVPTGLKDSLTTLVLGGEVVRQFKYELKRLKSIIYPSLSSAILYYSKLGFFFHKVQTFFN